MIIFFTNPNLGATAGITAYNLNTAAENAINILQDTYNITGLISENKKFNYTIEHQLPKWLTVQAKNDSTINVVKYLQAYYDWIFSANGLDLYPNYEDIQNVFYMNFDSLKETYKSLFSDFDFDDFGEEYETELREFLISNKKRFIVNKGNQDSFKYFIQTFFESVLDDYSISFGVNDTMVLNEGTLNTSYLTEGQNYQEYAVKLTAFIPEKYEDDFISMMKPVGFKFDLVKGQVSTVSATIAAQRFRPNTIEI